MEKIYSKLFNTTLGFNKTTTALLLLLVLTPFLNAWGQGTSCATATALTVNGSCLSGNITDDTQDLPNYTLCGGTFQREGWYTFTVTGGPLNVTITAIGNRNIAFQLLSSTSSCTGLSQISCINAVSGSGGSDATETSTQSLNNGIYYIKILNVGANNNMGLTSLCVTAVAPENTVPITGNNSYTLCSGNLYDNGGSTANYATSSNGYSVINPSVIGNYGSSFGFNNS